MFMFSRNKKSPSKKAAVVDEKPLYAQLLPFANVMTEKVQVVNALAFTLIMGAVSYTHLTLPTNREV